MVVVIIIGVLAVISVLAGLIAPRLSANSGALALRESANGLLQAARYARHWALTHGGPCRLVIDVHERRYHLEVESDKADNAGKTSNERDEGVGDDRDVDRGFSVLRSGPIKVTTLAGGVGFEAVRADSRHGAMSGRHTIEFGPTGEADAAVIQIGDDPRVYSVLIMPSTGRAELVERAASRLPNDREDLDG